jgi:hypothetical protein
MTQGGSYFDPPVDHGKGFKPIVSIGVAALNLFSSHGKPRAMVSQGSTARTQLAPEREDPP